MGHERHYSVSDTNGWGDCVDKLLSLGLFRQHIESRSMWWGRCRISSWLSLPGRSTGDSAKKALPLYGISVLLIRRRHRLQVHATENWEAMRHWKIWGSIETIVWLGIVLKRRLQAVWMFWRRLANSRQAIWIKTSRWADGIYRGGSFQNARSWFGNRLILMYRIPDLAKILLSYQEIRDSTGYPY